MKAVFMKNSAPDTILSQRSLASPASHSHSAPRALAPDSDAARRGAAKTPSAPKKPGGASKPKAGDDSKAGGDAKKRVRLKPETREQLLERLRNPPLSLHETSILLRVSRATVRRYADAGRLPCLRTPGGQRRFALRDIETFYRQLKIKR